VRATLFGEAYAKAAYKSVWKTALEYFTVVRAVVGKKGVWLCEYVVSLDDDQEYKLRAGGAEIFGNV
jgi:hypothetical protein